MNGQSICIFFWVVFLVTYFNLCRDIFIIWQKNILNSFPLVEMLRVLVAYTFFNVEVILL